MENLLEIKDLYTYFTSSEGIIPAVDHINFSIKSGETLGVVGESGCGKSVTSLSIMGLVPNPPGYIRGEVLFQGQNLLTKSHQEMRHIRGNDIAMIFQEPMTSLNPVFTIGDQISEAIRLHQGLNKKESLAKSEEMLRIVGVPDPDKRIHEFPHQLSGGMRQRVMIGMALSCNPKLLIADEPTTALDVTIQAQILTLMKKLKQEIGMTILLITHDLGVIAEMAERVIVMYAGKIVEETCVYDLFEGPLHPYTEGLFKCIPRIDQPRGVLNVIEGTVPSPLNFPEGCRFHTRCPYSQDICRRQEPPLLQRNTRWVACHFPLDANGSTQKWSGTSSAGPSGDNAIALTETKKEDLLKIVDLKKYFPVDGSIFSRHKSYCLAVDGISLTIKRGETFGLVGESGCGKTTVGRCILRLSDATSGSIFLEGKDILSVSGRAMRKLRGNMQVVFQDPFASLDPRNSIGQIVEEPLIVHKIIRNKTEREKRVGDLLKLVGLRPEAARRFPHELSGGQRQRVGIARALALNPKLIVCDEPVSALDVSIQSQVLNLLGDLQKKLGLSYLFIAHGLHVIKHVSDRVGVMYLGKLVEVATSEDLFQNPLHPYTKALISAIPYPDPKARTNRILLEGDVPSPINPPPGCRFHGRCREAMDMCRSIEPVLQDRGTDHIVSCHLYK
ncbi:MAG: ABC transporter ATP-binding protein [Desulfobacteraceae bacterium]|nr:ABC transporter ATP-binding protein [Desulfobacteraceae bacterium]